MTRKEKISQALRLLGIPEGLDPGANGDQAPGMITALYEATGWDDRDTYTGITGRSGRGYRRNAGPPVVNSWVKAFYDIVMAPAGIELTWKEMGRNYIMLRVDDEEASVLLEYVRSNTDTLYGKVWSLRAAITGGKEIAFDEARWARVHA